MEGFSVLFTLIAVGIALVGWRMVRRARENRWRAYAQRRGLHSRLVGRFRLFGVFERTVVALDEERRGSGKSRYTVTKASAFFGLPMPEGLSRAASTRPAPGASSGSKVPATAPGWACDPARDGARRSSGSSTAWSRPATNGTAGRGS